MLGCDGSGWRWLILCQTATAENTKDGENEENLVEDLLAATAENTHKWERRGGDRGEKQQKKMERWGRGTGAGVSLAMHLLSLVEY